MFRRGWTLDLEEKCAVCGYVFEFHPGDWSGAVMMAQMMMGVLAIPVWIVLMWLTPLDFTWSVVVTVAVVLGLWALTYRNVKGMWFGWLCVARGIGK
jgi:uncharacterized protein (DUF983 family)